MRRVFSFSGCNFQVARPVPRLLKSKTVLDIIGLWVRSQVFKIGDYIKISVTLQHVQMKSDFSVTDISWRRIHMI